MSVTDLFRLMAAIGALATALYLAHTTARIARGGIRARRDKTDRTPYFTHVVMMATAAIIVMGSAIDTAGEVMGS